MVHLNDIPNGNIGDSRMYVPSALPEGSALSFLGAHKPDDVSCAVAEGRLDPMTLEPFVVHVVDGIVHVRPPQHHSGDYRARVSAPAACQPTPWVPAKNLERRKRLSQVKACLHDTKGVH